MYKVHSTHTNGISSYFAAVNVASFMISHGFTVDAFMMHHGLSRGGDGSRVVPASAPKPRFLSQLRTLRLEVGSDFLESNTK